MFTENLAPFFSDFATAATLDGASVSVIFEEAGMTMADGIAAVAPQVIIATASVPASPYGKTLTIGARSFTVREHVPDGTGLSTLILTDA